MVRPQVADRGDGLQICRVAVNIVNKQLQTANSWWSSSLGVGQGLKLSPIKLIVCYKTLYTASEQDRIFAQPNHRKMDMRFDTWNVRLQVWFIESSSKGVREV
jgi:hypothetical protein